MNHPKPSPPGTSPNDDPSVYGIGVPEANGAAHLLAVRDLVVRFGGVTAVGGVSLTVDSGECCGLIGPNGAGKTSVFDAIAGQNSPSGGHILYGSQDISARSALWRSRNGIRRTFQRQQIFPGLSVTDNVIAAMEWNDPNLFGDLLGLPTRRRSERRHRAAAEALLERCGLYEVRNEAAYHLPLGQTRILELARAVCTTPSLLLLDEPTSGMESADVDRLESILGEIRDQRRCGVLLIEHDIGFVMAHAQRIYVMELGVIIESGTPAEVRNSDAVNNMYLGFSAADGAAGPGSGREGAV